MENNIKTPNQMAFHIGQLTSILRYGVSSLPKEILNNPTAYREWVEEVIRNAQQKATQFDVKVS